MKRFQIIPEGCRWSEVEAVNSEMAYRGACCWFNPSKRIAVRDMETGATVIYTRELDKAGNLVRICQE